MASGGSCSGTPHLRRQRQSSRSPSPSPTTTAASGSNSTTHVVNNVAPRSGAGRHPRHPQRKRHGDPERFVHRSGHPGRAHRDDQLGRRVGQHDPDPGARSADLLDHATVQGRQPDRHVHGRQHDHGHGHGQGRRSGSNGTTVTVNNVEPVITGITGPIAPLPIGSAYDHRDVHGRRHAGHPHVLDQLGRSTTTTTGRSRKPPAAARATAVAHLRGRRACTPSR